MQKKRPAAVMVIGILHIIFGTLGLLMGTGGMVMIAAGGDRALMKMFQVQDPQQMKQMQGYTMDEMYDYMEQRIPNYKTGQLVGGAIDLAFAALLLLAGIGLLKMASWGRGLSILYGVTSILVRILTVVLIFTVVGPVMGEFFSEAAKNAAVPQVKPLLEMMSTVMPIVMAASPLAYLIYPIITLIVMLLPSVGRAFRGEYPEEVAPMIDQYDNLEREV